MVHDAKRALVASRLKIKFTKRAHAEIEQTKKKSKVCKRYMACGHLHEVDDQSVAHTVDMDSHTCGCIKWQLTGIPCIHASCVIVEKKIKV